MTKILKINPVKPELSKIRTAAGIIKNGGIVAFPTETVYGLGANAFDKEAVLKVFSAKRRPADNPLIVHIADFPDLKTVATNVGGRVQKIITKIWPGPITLIFDKRAKVPKETCGGLDTVAVRMPAHPIALALIKESGVPIAAPSANLSTRPSPTNARHVIDDFNNAIDAIIDGGNTFFGLESTIIDARRGTPILLRPGAFETSEIKRLFGDIRIPDSARGLSEVKTAIAPGMKYRHYAPSKRLLLLEDPSLFGVAIKKLKERGYSVAALCSRENAGMAAGAKRIVLGSESNLYEVAHNLFNSFRQLDKSNADIGVIQPFKETGIGLAIMNRIRKATGHQMIGLNEVAGAL